MRGLVHLSVLAALVLPASAGAGPIVVNQNSDEPDADPGDGTADVDLATPGLQVTLRSAIEHANTSTTHQIAFELTDPMLAPATLPEILEPIEIDGSLVSGRVRLQQSLVLHSDGSDFRDLIIRLAPSDAITSHGTGSITLSNVDLTESTSGFGIRARGDVIIDGGVITSNARGGVLSAGDHRDRAGVDRRRLGLRGQRRPRAGGARRGRTREQRDLHRPPQRQDGHGHQARAQRLALSRLRARGAAARRHHRRALPRHPRGGHRQRRRRARQRAPRADGQLGRRQ